MPVIVNEGKKAPPKLVINLVLDESSSMAWSRDQTIEAVNGFIKKQKESDDALRGEVYFGITKFNTISTVVYSMKPIEEVEDLSHETYSPNGGTAFYDAVAHTVHHAEQAAKEVEGEKAYIVLIMTDGEENSSKEYRGEEGKQNLKKLVNAKEGEGNWTFVFMSGDLDTNAVTYGTQTMGVTAGNSTTFDKNNMRFTQNRVCDNFNEYRSEIIAKSADPTNVGEKRDLQTKKFFKDQD